LIQLAKITYFLLGRLSGRAPGFTLVAGCYSSSGGTVWSFFIKNSFKSKNKSSSAAVRKVTAMPFFPALPVLPVL
jgi:hypothetical protein